MKRIKIILSGFITLIIISSISSCSNNAKYLDPIDILNYQFKLDDSENQSKITELLDYVKVGKLKHREEIVKPYIDKMLRVNKSIADLRFIIDSMQLQLIKAGGGFDTSGISLKQRANTTVSYELMLKSGNAKELKKQLDRTINEVFDSSFRDTEKDLMRKALIDVKYHDDLANTPDWADKKFGKGIPLSLAVMNLSRIKSDLSCLAKILITSLIEEANSGCVLYFDATSAVVCSLSPMVFIGEEPYHAYIFLFNDKHSILGNDVSIESAEVNGRAIPVHNGIGYYSAPSTTPGEKTYEGKIKVKNIDGLEKEFNFKGVYYVTRRSASLDFANNHFIYSGIDNPLTVTVPLILEDRINLRLSRGEVTGSNGKYTIRVNDPGPVTIYVEDKLSKGSHKVIDSLIYSVKPSL